MEDAWQKLWKELLDTALGLLAGLDEELEAKHGLSALWYQVLDVLKSAPEGRLRLHELAASIRLSQSGTTRLVDRLEKEGLVQRSNCPGDRRVVHTSLRPAGVLALQRARPDWEAYLEKNLSLPLGCDNREALASLLERLKPGDHALEACPQALSQN